MASPSTRPIAILVGTNIRTARRRAGMTQEELAAVIGARGMAVSRWERGETRPRDGQEIALARVLFDGKIEGLYRELNEVAA